MSKTSIIALLLLACFAGRAQQDDFLKFGPYNGEVYKDLKAVFKEKTLPKVYKLELNYQKGDSLFYPKIGMLADLQALKLNGIAEDKYPGNTEKLVNLVYYGSFNCRFSNFPPGLKSWTNLMHLEIQHSTVDSIPAHIAYLHRLQTLRVGNTHDTLKLPNTLRYLRNLKELSIENCLLDSLPSEVFKIASLKYLFLSNTHTFYLSRQLGSLSNLEVMVIENNGLQSIPFDIYKAQKLRILALRGNKLSRLPDTISQLENLAVLDLRGNPISAEEMDKIKALLPGCEVKF